MNTTNALTACWLVGRAAACDITGWPSTTHHPSPVQLLPAAEIVATYRLTRPLIEEYVQVVRKEVRSASGDGDAMLEQADRGKLLAVHLVRPPSDWAVLDEAVKSITSSAGRQGAVVLVHLPPGAIDQAFRTVSTVAASLLGSAGSCQLDVRGGIAVVTFPVVRPPTAPEIWRLRKAALASPPPQTSLPSPP